MSQGCCSFTDPRYATGLVLNSGGIARQDAEQTRFVIAWPREEIMPRFA